MALQWPYFLGIRKGCLQLACQVDKSIFYWYFGVLPAQRRSLLWWTLALICDLRPPLNCQRPRRRGTPPPPSSRSIRSSPVRRGRTVRLHSLVSPSGWPCTDVPPAQGHPPSGARSFRHTDRPAHKKEQATGVRWLGWTGMLACLRSPAYPVHVATDTCLLDQSILI